MKINYNCTRDFFNYDIENCDQGCERLIGKFFCVINIKTNYQMYSWNFENS